MFPSRLDSRNSPPVLAVSLVVAGLVSCAAGLWLARIDLASLIERRVEHANGSISAETASWLRGIHFSACFLTAGLFFVGSGVLFHFLRPAVHRALDKFASSRMASSWGLALIACLAVLAYYFPTLGSGYFRYDDFDFLVVAADESLWTALLQPHGDHVLPAARLLASIGFQLFGVNAFPYNLWLLLALCSAIVAGMLLLEEVGVSRSARVVFITLVVFWSPWGEMMSGYYTLSIYMLIATLGMTTAWCYLCWRRTEAKAAAAGMVVSVLLAPLINLSGCYVAGIAGVFLAVDFAGRPHGSGVGQWLLLHKQLLLGLAAACTASGAILLYAYQVENPGVFLGMANEGARTFAQLFRDVAYLFDVGVLLSMATPFVYARLPVQLLGVLAIVVFIAWLMFFTAAWRVTSSSRRLILTAMLLVVLGVSLMITLGRPPDDSWIVRWAAKHVCPAYLWTSLLLATGWDTLWRWISAPRRRVFAESTVVALLTFVAAQNAFGLLGMAVSFPPFGYPAEIRDATRRRAAVDVLRNKVVGTMAANSEPGSVVPALDGRNIDAVYPSLFIYNLANYRPFFADLSGGLEFVRNPAMQRWHSSTVRTIPSLRDAVSPSVIRLLDTDPVLRSFYYAEVELEARAVPGTIADAYAFEGDKTECVIKSGPWDPETAHLLQIAARNSDALQDVPITVIFWSERLNADWRGTISLRQTQGELTEVDMRQIYAFALSWQVANLRVVFPNSGEYWIRLVGTVP